CAPVPGRRNTAGRTRADRRLGPLCLYRIAPITKSTLIMHGRRALSLSLSLTLFFAAAGCTTHASSEKSSGTGRTVTPEAHTGHAQIGAWGLDLTSHDPAVRPGDDFYRYADGKWQDTNRIPSDRSTWTTADELAERAEHDLRAIVESLP